MHLSDLIDNRHLFIADSFDNTDSFYAEYANFLKDNDIIKDPDKIKRLFIKREGVHSTAIGKGAAAPHIYSEEFSQFIFSIAIIKKGLDFKAPDKGKVYVVFLIMSDDHDVPRHLKTLSFIAKLVSDTNIIDELSKCNTPEDIAKILNRYDAQVF